MIDEDIFYALTVAYRSALNGNITIDGNIVPIYGATKQISSNANVYVLIQAQSSADSSTKVTTDSSTLVQISIYAKGGSLSGNEHQNIGSQVLQIIAPYPNYKLPLNANFHNVQQTVITDQIMPVRVGNTIEPTYERNIIIQHYITHKIRSLI